MNRHPLSRFGLSRLSGILLVCFLFPGVPVSAQCDDCSYASVKMWDIYGVNPYYPRQIPTIQFTPLQSQLYQRGCPVGCNSAPPINGELYFDDTAVAPAPEAIDDPSNIAPTGGAPGDEAPRIEAGADAIPSPSDIQLDAPGEGLVPAAAQTEAARSDMDKADAEIERLNSELVESKKNARDAISRAYAAEKAAASATRNAETKLAEAKKLAGENQQLSVKSRDALVEHQKKIEQMMMELEQAKSNLRAEKKLGSQRQLKLRRALEKAQSETNQAMQQAKQAEADLEQSSQPNRSTEAQSMVQQLTAQAAGSTDDTKEKDSKKAKRPRTKFNADEQIKKLKQSMQRQIDKSSAQITKRNQAEINELLKSHSDDDPDVKAARDAMKTELDENETKIRKRIDARIRRIRKEAEARARS